MSIAVIYQFLVQTAVAQALRVNRSGSYGVLFVLIWAGAGCHRTAELAQPARGLTATEQRIMEVAAARKEAAIALLERAVNIPSKTENLAGVKRTGELFDAELRELGFATRWVDMPAAMQRAGHLIAERRGAHGKRLLLIGHLDTVFEGQTFRRDGGRATGSGIYDMKGGDVILIEALRALHAVGALEDRTITVIFTGDEEDAGLPLAVSRRALFELARQSDIALAFEAVIDETATVARRGYAWWQVRVSAEGGHSSGIFDPHHGAIFELARILDAFRRELVEKDLSYNPSVILGGTEVEFDSLLKRGRAEGKLNVIPAQALAEGDLRFVSEAQRERARQRMEKIVDRSLQGTTATLIFHDDSPAMAPAPANYALLGILDRASREAGLGPLRALAPGERGAGDISFIAAGLPSLDGLGISGDGAHTTKEVADLDSLPRQIQRSALLLYRLTR